MNKAGNSGKLTFEEILLMDEFLAYHQKQTPQIIDFWEKQFESEPDTRVEFDKALRLNSLLTSSKKDVYSDQLKEALLKKLLKKINREEKLSKTQKSKVFSIGIKVAAAVLLVIGLSWIYKVVFQKQNVLNANIAYNEIIVPSGEKTQVVLPDGTKIWLNSESKLKYASVFDKHLRSVQLEGEGYFDVSKIKGSKFIVNTQGVKIEVLGTIFNVKSYPDEETIETSVVEGKVKVDAGTSQNPIEPVYILPSERSIYYKNFSRFSSTAKKKIHLNNVGDVIMPKTPITVGEVNIANIICWKDHLLVFENETFEEIAVKMARWYKIKVTIKDENLKKQRFTGKFVNNETFYQVLEAINITTPIEYKYEKDELVVMPHRYLKKLYLRKE